MEILDQLAPQLSLGELICLVSELSSLEELNWQVYDDEAGLRDALTTEDAQYYRRRLNEAQDLRDGLAQTIIDHMKKLEADRE